MSAAMIGASHAAATAIAEAIKASGTLVRVEPKDFLAILARSPEPLVVHAPYRFWRTSFDQYLTSYKGLAFFTRSEAPLSLPMTAEVIHAKSIYIPG